MVVFYPAHKTKPSNHMLLNVICRYHHIIRDKTSNAHLARLWNYLKGMQFSKDLKTGTSTLLQDIRNCFWTFFICAKACYTDTYFFELSP